MKRYCFVVMKGKAHSIGGGVSLWLCSQAILSLSQGSEVQTGQIIQRKPHRGISPIWLSRSYQRGQVTIQAAAGGSSIPSVPLPMLLHSQALASDNASLLTACLLSFVFCNRRQPCEREQEPWLTSPLSLSSWKIR